MTFKEYLMRQDLTQTTVEDLQELALEYCERGLGDQVPYEQYPETPRMIARLYYFRTAEFKSTLLGLDLPLPEQTRNQLWIDVMGDQGPR